MRAAPVAPPEIVWLNKPDACVHAGKISHATIARWVDRGYITAHRVDNRTMYLKSEIDAFLAGQRVEVSQPKPVAKPVAKQRPSKQGPSRWQVAAAKRDGTAVAR